MMRGIGLHLVLLAIAASGAILVWTRDDRAIASVGDVVVWTLENRDVSRIVLEKKGEKLVLEARRDAHGRYFFGTAEGVLSRPPEGTADESDEPGERGPNEPAPTSPAGSAAQPTTVTFVSVTPAEKVLETMAPLKAQRALGTIADDRAAECGREAPEGSLVIVTGAIERRLDLGSAAPGGASRYVRDAASRRVFAVKSEVLEALASGASALGEQELHGFKDADVRGVRILTTRKREHPLRAAAQADLGRPGSSRDRGRDRGQLALPLRQNSPDGVVRDAPRGPRTRRPPRVPGERDRGDVRGARQGPRRPEDGVLRPNRANPPLGEDVPGPRRADRGRPRRRRAVSPRTRR